ncbi:2-succinyl-6-hydroxy-2,4-cyclohexadiene-1-carboxylate synthase [Bacillus marinisedimentorum]|uniref:2-succinyl-6-hydroxy-2, 4-cyclohexadiene-1-carboxylate synthase n=1 Tax=Bacillus marinisedimentorum TaxID=1821260 RepID=UPI001FDF845C|nr:2-succinyl-6-hydroxy-2,4-cyclohexadiene-1-carboxylate synthase [Bacillus marinisedimentorum]
MSNRSHAVINGLGYSYEVKGQGAPLLLLHGFTGDISTWNPVVDRLAEQYRTIAVDLPGHGKTEAPENPDRYGAENTAKDLAGLLDYLGIDRAYVLGYSMGGRLALTFSFLYKEKVKGLILESASPGLKSESERSDRRARDEKLASMIDEVGIKAFVDYWENIPLFASQRKLPEDSREEIRRQRLNQRPHGLANSLRGFGTGSQPSWWKRLGELEVPVILLAGELDTKFVAIADEMEKGLGNAEKRVVKETGHAIHVEQPQIFGKIVVDCMKMLSKLSN